MEEEGERVGGWENGVDGKRGKKICEVCGDSGTVSLFVQIKYRMRRANFSRFVELPPSVTTLEQLAARAAKLSSAGIPFDCRSLLTAPLI